MIPAEKLRKQLWREFNLSDILDEEPSGCSQQIRPADSDRIQNFVLRYKTQPRKVRHLYFFLHANYNIN